jgi:hypothetical protein
MKSSKLFRLNIWDFIKGVIVAVLTPVIVLAQDYFSQGMININLKSLVSVGISGFLAYILKNFFSSEPKIKKDVKLIDFQIENSVVGGRPNERGEKN